MFAGTGGSGVKDMPSAHSQVMPKKCVTCHMHREGKEEEEKAGAPLQKGGHTFRSNEKVCLKCHEDPRPLMAKWQTGTSSLLKRLKALLDSTPNKTSESYKAAKLNYDIVIADGEMGLHNPKYAQALLQYGISCLTAESVWKP
jgi:formate-dependent nitrite reductase cytochrome c552 subunit